MRFFALFLLVFTALTKAETVLTYPHQSFSDGYPLTLLKLALEKAAPAEQYKLEESTIETHQGRALKLLAQNVEIDVAWSMTSIARENELLAIKIPIYKGLFGYRVFLIKQEQQAHFSTSLPLSVLQNERLAVQGHDWPDIEVLKHNNYKVESVEFYDAMFELLHKGRADYFPRSILEAWREAATHKAEGIVVEQHHLLHYPAYVFYFVHKDNKNLAHTIKKGLLASIEDGSFDVLFDTIEDGAIAKTDIPKRRVIQLTNPTIDTRDVYQWPKLQDISLSVDTTQPEGIKTN
ncbi:transporter substrate-binding domain-containing protein [Planctobacterium marinum]|uniref:Solute-binding protein family 3/N-terminal domain-containing protein n=1 Tax=Planctobacterium marinum TaxID=1631968 RepID=A0AA48HYR1_9ALTE|nr:hypothetical protein MACH26_38140 [Planctobacterium marinum]